MVHPGASGKDAKIVYRVEESNSVWLGRTYQRPAQRPSVFGIMSNLMLRRLG